MSGPLLDRFDLRLTVKPVDAEALLEGMSVDGAGAIDPERARGRGTGAMRIAATLKEPAASTGATSGTAASDAAGGGVALAPGTVNLAALAHARERQRERARRLGLPRASNARIPPHALRAAVCATGEATDQVLESARKMSLSGRGIHRALRVARTIADLEDVAHVSDKHVREALHYRGEDT